MGSSSDLESWCSTSRNWSLRINDLSWFVIWKWPVVVPRYAFQRRWGPISMVCWIASGRNWGSDAPCRQAHLRL